MHSCDTALKIRAIFNFGPQKELSRAFGSGFDRFGFRI